MADEALEDLGLGIDFKGAGNQPAAAAAAAAVHVSSGELKGDCEMAPPPQQPLASTAAAAAPAPTTAAAASGDGAAGGGEAAGGGGGGSGDGDEGGDEGGEDADGAEADDGAYKPVATFPAGSSGRIMLLDTSAELCTTLSCDVEQPGMTPVAAAPRTAGDVASHIFSISPRRWCAAHACAARTRLRGWVDCV